MAQLPVELILVRQLAHGLAVPTFVLALFALVTLRLLPLPRPVGSPFS